MLLVEGATELAIKAAVKAFLDERCVSAGRPKVRLTARPINLLRERELRDFATRNLAREDVLGVVALTDVKCAGRPRQFKDASEAIAYLRGVVGEHRGFRAHAAQFDVEAWLLPYWDDICRRLGISQAPPGPKPERIDLDKPPSQRLIDLYRRARRDYNKPRDAAAILRGKDLTVSAARCPQFKAFLDSLLELAGCRVLA